MSDRNTCPTCGLRFNSTAAFAKHRVGDFSKSDKPSPYGPVRRCMTVAEMEERGMLMNASGWWISKAFTLVCDENPWQGWNEPQQPSFRA